jgi:hypothetical protein
VARHCELDCDGSGCYEYSEEARANQAKSELVYATAKPDKLESRIASLSGALIWGLAKAIIIGIPK